MSIAHVTMSRGADEAEFTSRTSPLAALRHMDFLLLGAVGLVTAMGILVLKGATDGAPGLGGIAEKQIVFSVIAISAMLAAYLVHYRWINRVGMALYVFNLGALFFVLATAKINGARSWIDLGPVNWQPSETMKIAAVVVCAQWLALHPEKLESWRSIFIPGVICGTPALLVLVQPDFGTASLFFIMFLTMMLMAGVSKKKLGAIMLAAVMGMACMYPMLKSYQKARLLSFLNPEADPRNTGYQVIQSKVAIGSGGLTGQGWNEGTQSIHRFLPEHHTDFIFSSAVEQLGIIGALIILAGFFFIIWRMLVAMDTARDRFGGLTVAGLTGVFAGHVVLNIGITMGLFPVTGIPLPLMSYGGSFMVTTFMLFGIVLNVSSRRFTFAGW